MKLQLTASLLCLALGACATTGLTTDQRRALYESHAGAPVGYFQYFGSINGWTPLGDSAIAVWTKPAQAYLLDLAGPCPDIEYTPVITVTNENGRVYRNFDKVIARGRSTFEIPCPIKVIRPLDVKAIRSAEKTARDTPAQAQSVAPPGSATGT